MYKYFFHAYKIIKSVAYYIYTSVIPKDNNLWLFGSWKGTTYNDNSKYVFEYVIEHHPEIKAVWITRKPDVYKYLQEKQLPVAMFPSTEADSLIRKARFLFQTEGYKDTGDMPVGGATVIQLWHGGPGKALNWFSKNNKLKNVLIRLETGDKRKFYWVSQSAYYSQFHSKVFDIPVNHFINTGSPRCDAVNLKSSLLINKIKKQGCFEKIILYLPTHRNWGKDFNNEFIIRGLDIVESALKGTKICFLFKPHPNEIDIFRSKNKCYKNVVILDGKSQEQQDLYQYLFRCDALVSDYSTVIYDYLICNKPIVLFTYDFQKYQEVDGGVTDEYVKKPLGPHVESWEEMIRVACDLLVDDTWKNNRENVQDFFNGYHTAHNSERLVNFLLNNFDDL